MQAVKDWVFMLLISSIIGSVLIYIVPEGGMNKYVKFVSGLCAAAIAVVPIAAAVRQAPSAQLDLRVPSEAQYGDSVGHELIVRQTVSMLEDETRKMIYQKTSINPANIYIYIEQAENSSSAGTNGESELTISGVKAVLKEEDMIRSEEVYLCLRDFLDCEAEVTAEE
ncbi:MAG: hypothetical protein AB9835_03370 [Eubacteriales bacterium]